jgi:hypothetical protein
MTQMDDSQPKAQIPETWATKMSCPVCGSRPLGVFHPTGQADRFICQSCETSFELEDIGTRVRFVTLPQGVTPWMRSKWVALEEALKEFAAHQNETLIVPPVTVQSAEPKEEIHPEPAETNLPEKTENIPSVPESPLKTDTDVILDAPLPEKTAPVDSKSPSPFEEMGPIYLPAGNAVKSLASPAPFYEDDFIIPGIYPDQIRSEKGKPADEVWKNFEDERVKNLQLHPPSQESASVKPVNNMVPINLDSETRLQESPIFSVDSIQPTTLAGSVSKNQVINDSVDLSNPPPVNQVEDTPPSPVSYSRPVQPSGLPEKDLRDLRSQIFGAGISPSLNEKMQTASQRAIELQRLGNTENEVRSILERSSGLTPEEVADVLKGLEKPIVRRRIGMLLLIFSAIAIVIFTLIAWWYLASITDVEPVNQNSGTAETQTTGLLPGELISAESLPSPLQTLLPKGVRILNDPPSVEISTSDVLPPTTCPKSKTEAAALFGGPAGDWNADKQNLGWVLVSQQQSLEIKVPTNMTAGYLVFERGPEMRSVTGPAIVRNVYMITVSCQ